MIRKEKSGWSVWSEKGKRLSKPYRSKKAAEKRLGQIEYFKHKDNNGMKHLIDISEFLHEAKRVPAIDLLNGLTTPQQYSGSGSQKNLSGETGLKDVAGYTVYSGWKDGQLVYIGTTIQKPSDRFRWHKHNGKPFTFVIEKQFDNESDMLDYEFELIKKHKPKFNSITHRKQNLNKRLTQEQLDARVGDKRWCQSCLRRSVNPGYSARTLTRHTIENKELRVVQRGCSLHRRAARLCPEVQVL